MQNLSLRSSHVFCFVYVISINNFERLNYSAVDLLKILTSLSTPVLEDLESPIKFETA